MNQKISVCHLTSPHPRYDIRVFHKECVSLVKYGYKVTLIVADGNKDEKLKGVHIVGVLKPKNKLNRLFKTTEYIYKKALEIDADIYHFHDPELILVGLKLNNRGKKVVYDVHEDLPRQLFVKKYGVFFLKKLLETALEKFELHAASKYSAVFTVTPHIKSRFVNVNDNVDTLRNFPLLEEFSTNSVDWNRRKKEMVFVGNIIAERGIYQIVNAIEKLDIKLNICGNFSNKNLQHDVSLLPGWKKVNYHGFVGREKITEVLNESYAGLITMLPVPNFINSYPIKMFEYMAASIPVIASDFPLFKELVEGNKCGICVNPNDSNEIAKAIKYLIDNPKEAKKMGENGRKIVLKEYNWEKESKKLSTLYQKIIKIE